MNLKGAIDLFPELKSRVMESPLFVRILIAIAILSTPYLIPGLAKYYRKIILFLVTNFSIELPTIIWIVILVILVYTITNIIRHIPQRKKIYLEFIVLWELYKDVLPKIQNLMERDPLSDEELKEAILEYCMRCHEIRDKIKVLLCKIKKTEIFNSSSYDKWNAFLDTERTLRAKKFKTPFDFLTDYVNALAFNKHYGIYWKEVIHIGDDFINNLKYSLFSKKKLFKEIEKKTKEVKEMLEVLKTIHKKRKGIRYKNKYNKKGDK